MIELRHLRYFVAVAEEEHFGRAAARLRISTPPLSRQVRQLEEEVGVPLLERIGRGVRLSPAGRDYLARARALLAEVEAAAEAARAVARGEVGHLRVAFAETLPLLELVPRVIARFRAAHPRVTIEPLPMRIGDQVEALRARRINAGFRYYRVTEAGIVSDVLWRDPVVLLLPRRHPLARLRAVRLAAVRDEPFVWAPSPNYYDEVRAALLARGVTRRVVEVESALTRMSLVAAGVGLGCTVASVRPTLGDQVVLRPFADFAIQLDAVLAYRAEDAAAPFVRSLRALSRQVLRGTGAPG